MREKILIGDDHSAIRTGVKQICKHEFPTSHFGEAANYAEVLRQLSSEPWDILILDIDLHGRNGLDILKELRILNIKIPVLIFTFHQDEQIALRAIKLGASGYLSKDAADDELIKAIKLILAGKKFLPQSMAENLIEMIGNESEKEPHELLSGREYQILVLIGSGKTVTEIAALLFLSVPTIGTYRARILQKMKLKNNAQLINYVISQKLK